MRDGQFADCGHGIFVGNYEVCGQVRAAGKVDRAVHLWHPKQRGHCPCSVPGLAALGR